MKLRSIILFAGSFLSIICASLALLHWCPWLNEDIAKEKSIAQFDKVWQSSQDGCYLDCIDCGVTAVKKVPFG